MAEETTVTPVAETIAPVVEPVAPVVPTETTKTPEGSVASIVAETKPTVEPKKDETVPLSVYLELKSDLKELKQTLKDRPQTASEERATVKAITEKYKDVDPDFIKGIVDAAVAETESKYAPILEGQNREKKEAEFNKAFDAIYDKALGDNPDAKNVDKELIKTLALTPKYNNTPLSDLIKQVYGSSTVGKESTENDLRISADVPDENIDIEKITPEQRARIMENPTARAAYFAKLDALGR